MSSNVINSAVMDTVSIPKSNDVMGNLLSIFEYENRNSKPNWAIDHSEGAFEGEYEGEADMPQEANTYSSTLSSVEVKHQSQYPDHVETIPGELSSCITEDSQCQVCPSSSRGSLSSVGTDDSQCMGSAGTGSDVSMPQAIPPTEVVVSEYSLMDGNVDDNFVMLDVKYDGQGYNKQDDNERSPRMENQYLSPTARVFDHLDGIMRDRINLEVEEFRYNVHTILNEQQGRIHQLIDLAHQSKDQDLQDNNNKDTSNSKTLNLENEIREEDEKCVRGDENQMKNECLIQLFTYSAILNSTLQRQEYHI